MIRYNIKKVPDSLDRELVAKINSRTKPVGSLGLLEKVAFTIGRVQQSLSPRLSNPHHILFGADHGIADMGISPCSMDVTYQMMYNFLEGGGAINVFCKQNGIEFVVVDSGVNHIFEGVENLIDAKIGMGTKNYYNEPAMTHDELIECFKKANRIVEDIHSKGSNVIGFGEMGIGNTSSSSMIMSCLCDIPLVDCVGAGAGFCSEGTKRKYNILQSAMDNHPPQKDPLEVLRHFGGFEVAMMTAGMLKAAELEMVVLIDGFIATASFLVAHALNPNIKDYAVFCHKSMEQGHKLMIEYLGVEPLLDLNLRLGEGTAIALAYPLIEASVNFLNQMASVESAKLEEPVNLHKESL